MKGQKRMISSWVSISSSTSKSNSFLSLLLLSALAMGCEEAEVPETRPESISVDSPFGYPVTLWDAGVEGETVVMVHVTDIGGVDSVYVLEGSGEAGFDSAAVAGAYELKFAPGRRGDQRVATWVRLPVRFRMDEPGAGGTQ